MREREISTSGFFFGCPIKEENFPSEVAREADALPHVSSCEWQANITRQWLTVQDYNPKKSELVGITRNTGLKQRNQTILLRVP